MRNVGVFTPYEVSTDSSRKKLTPSEVGPGHSLGRRAYFHVGQIVLVLTIALVVAA